ncbi:MAG: bifunctional phosphoribosylaminoimidazolecarboxamide formyltransferase/IMP cyclohydrolase [Chloroflexaceae bacterium]|nr:bifunctional phosphoribosylaminoimidazolecarboxamide formyltransferase/IMP cyclohydrolase [Chloroflexaceae bacterium]
MRALISVSDKQHVVTLAQALTALNIELVSTGNTQRLLTEHGLSVRSVSDLTGFPEMLDGRVKTLHPAIHGAILARRDLDTHLQQLTEHAIAPIDIVVVNLYPFAQTIARPDVLLQQALEQIDIGGVALVRAAAKNFPAVLPLVNPADYAEVIAALETGAVPMQLRQRLAARAFAHTAAYDAAIATYLHDAADVFPATLTLGWEQAQMLRYGENPHQRGALYGRFFDYFEHLHGKELSYTNVLDISAAQGLIEDFPAVATGAGTTLAILKHTNPCGVGTAATLAEAWHKALATDPLSPFGGVIVLNAPCDLELAQAIDAIFSEIILAPDFAAEAFDLLQKKKNRRLIRVRQPITQQGRLLVQSVPGGVLVQEADAAPLEEEHCKVVTERAPTDDEIRALRFAWRVVKHVKSNAIVYATTDRTLGIGAGQMSRVDSSRLAVWKAQQAGLSLQGSVVASDALFPFADGVEAAIEAGATAIIQPGGSLRDEEVIAAANRAGAAMLFTGRRHFWH